MAIEKILIVDDEPLVRNFLAEALQRKKFTLQTAENGKKALSYIKDTTYDLVITDMKMPDITGIDVLRVVKEKNQNTIVIVITAYGSIENAVEAMRLGAFNYLMKPFSPDIIEAVIEKAKDHIALVQENQYLRQELGRSGVRNSHDVVCESKVMKDIMKEIKQVAKSNASIFISGESGTGKEVISHAIHRYSARYRSPYIRVNCAAIPESLVESEFFGHEKGSFTGAQSKRMGRFELADGGTLLLDEITEIPIGLQAKLLRVIQEKEFERVGGSKLIPVDVRIVATSNRDMREAIKDKIFREDLYYRLNVIPIHLPPLRDRRADILPLARHFLKNICIENHREMMSLSKEGESKLFGYDWPGNIRELINVIERAVVLGIDRKIAAEHLFIQTGEVPIVSEKDDSGRLIIGRPLREVERNIIIETLKEQNDNRTKTAQILGISIRTLRNKIQEYRNSGHSVG